MLCFIPKPVAPGEHFTSPVHLIWDTITLLLLTSAVLLRLEGVSMVPGKHAELQQPSEKPAKHY